MKILFVVPYPIGRSPSQRFRFEQYFDILTKAGHQYRVQSFLDERGWDTLYQPGKVFRKAFSVIAGFARRWRLMLTLADYDMVFIHREAAPVGPPIFEWFIAKVKRKKIVYDFDDAIWTTDKTDESFIAKLFRWRSKVGYTCKLASVVSCGNDYLANYARRFNQSVVVNPTTIDTSYHKPVSKNPSNRIIIGWTGSHSTLKYLDELMSALKVIGEKFPNTSMLVISNGSSSLPHIPWKIEREIEDLAKIDIGIMPLPDDEWSKGKCGFKALQYMAMGMPTVASPVGVNTLIIEDGVNGLLCSTHAEWIEKISTLINDTGLRKKIGEAGRQTVEQRYSVVSNTSTFLSLFERSASITSANR